MIYRLEIRPEVFADIEKPERWYDEREPNLGAEFVRETIAAIGTLSNNPLGYRVRHKRRNVRWKLMSKFPYRVVFRVQDDRITIIGVIHSARHDRQWRLR